MAGITKIHPVINDARGRSFLGKTIMGFTVDIAVNATDMTDANMGPGGVFQAILQTVGTMATIVGHSAVRADAGANAGQVFDVYVEGEFGSDKYDGSNSETLAVHLEDLVQGLGTVNSVNLGSATVTAVTGFPLFANELIVE